MNAIFRQGRRAAARVAIAAAVGAACLGTAGAQDRGGPRSGSSEAAGNFDFYLLALSWSPTFCTENQGRDREQCASGRQDGFVVHGLWPEYDRGRSPENCDTRSPTRQQVETIHGLYPDDGLARYEWRVHGTCSGKNPTEYYAAVKAARAAVTIPAAFAAPKSEQKIPSSDISRAFVDANKGLRLNAMSVTCRSGTLQEVRLCLSKDLRQFVSCPQVARASCRSREIIVPPVH